MKSPKSSRTILFKKTLVVLCILFGIELLAITLYGIYEIIYIIPNQIQAKNFSITAEDIKVTPFEEKISPELANLEILPEYYDTLTENLGAFTPHELTTYLRYGEVSKKKDTTNLTNGYKYLKDSNLNILIPQSYIDQYLLTKILSISNLMVAANGSNEFALPYLNMGKNSSIHKELTQCISNDIDSFLKGETCGDILAKINNEELSPTLSFLTTSLVFTNFETGNEYDTYINNQLYTYQLNKVNTLVASSDNTNMDSNDTYLDLNQEHIYRAQLIVNYLKVITTKLGDFGSTVTGEISDLDTLVNSISTYKYGDTIPDEIKMLVSNQLINMSPSENTYTKIDPEIAFLIKSFNIDGETKTFIAPMYTFSSNDEIPITSLSFDINDNNFNEPYDVTPTAQGKGTVRIPIFMYHQIAPIPAGQSSFVSGLYIDPLDFEKQMAYLVKKNYKTASSYEYATLLKAGKNPAQKTVMLTFDDGVSNHYSTAYPILRKYGLTGVFYIVSQRSAVTQAQTKEMSNGGMDIGSHSAHHPDLTKVSDTAQLSSEIVSSKYSLQSATGKTVYSFAYPGCGYNSQTLSYVASAGYAIAVSCGSTIDNYPGHSLTLSRVHAFGEMSSFKNLLSGVR